MKGQSSRVASFWSRLGPELLPFADAASDDLPLSRLLRLSLFQFSTGMAIVLLNGTLNRVMIVELGISASIVAIMIALPLLLAPARALVGFHSDNYPSYLGWRRLPFICLGTMALFGGLAILPFALINLSGDTNAPMWIILAATGLAFFLVGAGFHTTQTAGLALATDLVPEGNKARAVALLYVMLLVGMIASSVIFSWLLQNFSQIRLIQVIQGAAVVSLLLNTVALWKQEALNPELTRPNRIRPKFLATWRAYVAAGNTLRFLFALGLGTAAFGMQDILLEPYGGQVFNLDVGATTFLTAILTGGMLFGLYVAARSLGAASDPYRVAAYGVTVGAFAFAAIVMAAPLNAIWLFKLGTFCIGFGAGLFSVGMLTASMHRSDVHHSGLALGAWGAVQALATGAAVALGGILRDIIDKLAQAGKFGPILDSPGTGYLFVYHVEIALLFLTLVVIGPLVGSHLQRSDKARQSRLELARFPG